MTVKDLNVALLTVRLLVSGNRGIKQETLIGSRVRLLEVQIDEIPSLACSAERKNRGQDMLEFDILQIMRNQHK